MHIFLFNLLHPFHVFPSYFTCILPGWGDLHIGGEEAERLLLLSLTPFLDFWNAWQKTDSFVYIQVFPMLFSKCFVFLICSCYIFWYSHLFLYSTPCFGPRFEMNHFLLFPNMLSEIPLNMPDQFEWNFMKDNKWLFLKNLYTVRFFIILPCNQSMSCQPLSPIKWGVRTVQHAVLR